MRQGLPCDPLDEAARQVLPAEAVHIVFEPISQRDEFPLGKLRIEIAERLRAATNNWAAYMLPRA